MLRKLSFVHYLALTKPRISLLFAWTALAAICLEGSLLAFPFRIFLICLGTFLVGGGANAINQYLERDLDKQMQRTAKKRPLPLGKIRPQKALWFGWMTCVLGLVLLWIQGGHLSFALGLATILYYTVFYTLLLKPITPYNIVIGGAAGATGPLIGWAAATQSLSWESILMFLLIFLWTPPHFWALALVHKEDYEKVSLPMFPVVFGDKATRKQILLYALALIPTSLLLTLSPLLGPVYFTLCFLLNLGFLSMAWNLYTLKLTSIAHRLFGYSIIYLMSLFTVIIVDGLFHLLD